MNGSPLSAQRPEDTSWDMLVTNLAAFLYGLPPGAKLVLSADGNRYVQFAAEEDVLDAEVSSNEYLEEPWRLSDADHQALAAAGWTLPEERYENWQRREPLTRQNCAVVAERSVDALRTALRVPAPSRITPDGWVDHRGLNGSRLDLTPLGLGPGKIDEGNARSSVHYYLLEHGLPYRSDEFQGTRVDGGWVFVHDADGDPQEFCVSDDHHIERRPPHVPSVQFQEAFGRRYRERNGLPL